MNVSIKKGSAITIPLLAGMNVTSNSPGVVTAKMAGTSVSLTAVGAGSAELTLTPASDLSVTLRVTVTA